MQDKTKTIEHLNSPQNYSEIVDAILATPLTVENVDTYADSALNQLIDFIEDAKKQYNRQPTVFLDGDLSPRQQEDIVASYFGISDINQILEHIVSKSHQLDDIDNFIKEIRVSDKPIITPHPEKRVRIKPGNGSFERAITAPKLKTLLFILENEFEIDIKNQEELKIVLGEAPKDAMRQEGYYQIEIPSLNRTVLICDEFSNITFVLDSSKLIERGIDTEDLSRITKQELQEVISQDETFGQAITHTRKFTSKLVHSLNDLSKLTKSEDDLENPNYLAEVAPEGFLSVNRASKKLKVSHATIVRAISELGMEPDGKYKFKGATTDGYSPQKVQQIREHLEQKGTISEDVPEGYLPISGIADSFGVDFKTVERAINILVLAPDINARSGYYGPEKINQIQNCLSEGGVFNEQTPEGYLSMNTMAEEFGIDYMPVKKAIEALGIQDDGEYKNVNRLAKVYGPEMIAKIRKHLEEKGFFAGSPPEGYLNTRQIAEEFNLSDSTIAKTISELVLESDGLYRFSGRITDAYSPEKIQLIKLKLEEKGILAEKVPEGYMSVGGMMKRFKNDSETIKKAIAKLGIEPDGRYKNKARVTDFYNPEKVEKIRLHIEERRRKLGQKAVS